jgi:tRNA G46 methylase TrmB
MDIKQSLASFYDAQAEKYYHTRNKHRADADVFLNEINSSEKKTINILEFGCGSGRLLVHLAQMK